MHPKSSDGGKNDAAYHPILAYNLTNMIGSRNKGSKRKGPSLHSPWQIMQTYSHK
jgi:hypothetical protein